MNIQYLFLLFFTSSTAMQHQPYQDSRIQYAILAKQAIKRGDSVTLAAVLKKSLGIYEDITLLRALIESTTIPFQEKVILFKTIGKMAQANSLHHSMISSIKALQKLYSKINTSTDDQTSFNLRRQTSSYTLQADLFLTYLQKI